MNMRPQELRQEYESAQRAAHYLDVRWTHSARARRTNRKEQAIVSTLLESLVAKETLTRVLDLPCGTGRFRSLLQQHFREVWSSDAAREMLSQVPPKQGFQASAHAIPLQSKSVDVILCSRLLHHFEHSSQRQVVLKELTRVSRRWIILSYFDAFSLQAWRNRRRGKMRGRFPITHHSFAAELQSAGLVEQARYYIARGVSEQVWVLAERLP